MTLARAVRVEPERRWVRERTRATSALLKSPAKSTTKSKRGSIWRGARPRDPTPAVAAESGGPPQAKAGPPGALGHRPDCSVTGPRKPLPPPRHARSRGDARREWSSVTAGRWVVDMTSPTTRASPKRTRGAAWPPSNPTGTGKMDASSQVPDPVAGNSRESFPTSAIIELNAGRARRSARASRARSRRRDHGGPTLGQHHDTCVCRRHGCARRAEGNATCFGRKNAAPRLCRSRRKTGCCAWMPTSA